MVLGSLVIIVLCFKSVQVREIFSFHERKALDHALEEDVSENSALYSYDVEHERDHLNIHVFVYAEARNSLRDPESLWVDGKVPYNLSSKYDAEEKATILEAMEEFKNRTCIRFEPRVKEETPFINIEPGSGCSATVGKSEKGRLSLGKGCVDKGIIIHELMHILGFLHEHSRPDRDDFIQVNFENIDKKYKSNFEKHSVDEVTDGNITYDYNSVMHYGEFNFAKNRSIPTIITLQENVTIGQRDGFSEKDIEKILVRYGCRNDTDNNGNTTTVSPSTRPDPTNKTTQNTPAQSTSTKKTTLSVEETTPGVQKSSMVTETTSKIIVDETTRNTPTQSTSTTKATFSIAETTPGVQKSSMATETTRNILTKTNTIQQTTHSENNIQSLLSKLEIAIARLEAANRKMMPNFRRAAKPATANRKTTPRHTTMAKLATASRKMTPTLTAIRSKSTSQYGSGPYRRFKRNARHPTYNAAEDDEEVEAPVIVESVEAEPEVPMVSERRIGVGHEFAGGSDRTDLDDFNDRYDEWQNRYRAWWSNYYKWVRQLQSTPETITGDEPLLSEEPSEIKSSSEVKADPSISTSEKQVDANDDTEASGFHKDSLINPIIPRSMTAISNTPPSASSETVNFVTMAVELTTPGSISPGTISPQKTTLESEISTSRDPDTSSPANSTSGIINTVSNIPIGTASETIHSDITTVEFTTTGSRSPVTASSQGTTLEIDISTSKGLGTTVAKRTTTISNTFIGTKLDTTNSGTTAGEFATPGITSTDTKSPQQTTLEKGISTSRNPGKSTPEINSSAGISSERGNSVGTTENIKLGTGELEKVISTLATSSISTAGSPNTISNSPTETISENMTSDIMADEPTTSGSTSPKTKSPQRTTLENEISTSRDPDRSTFESSASGSPNTISNTPSGTTSERVTSDIIHAEPTTPGSTSSETTSSQRSTLESEISTSRDPGTSAPRSTTANSNNAPVSKSETVNFGTMAIEIVTPGSISPETISFQRTTLASEISTRRDPGTSAPRSMTANSITATGFTLETVNSGTMAVELAKPRSTIPETTTSQRTTLENEIFPSRDPGTSTPRSKTANSNTPTGSTPETVNSGTMAVELVTPGSTSPETSSSQRTTLERSIPEIITSSKTSSERENSEGTTENIQLRTDELEKVISTSATSNKTTPGSPNTISNTPSVTASENVTPDALTPALTIGNAMGPETESSGGNTSVGLEKRAMQPRFPDRKRKSSKNEHSDDPAEKEVNHDTESATFPRKRKSWINEDSVDSDEKEADHDTESITSHFELAVDPRKHSTPHHQVRIYYPVEGRTALRNPKRLWPGGIVPYEISDKYNEEQKGFLLAGMEEFKKKTCVRFQERKDETSYIFIEPEEQCKSVIGRQEAMSTVTLSAGCYNQGTIIHEFMHAIGFVHEHNRPDRDSYVLVMWDNIDEGAKVNFKKHPARLLTTLGVEYDYDSVMHYSANEFAIDPDKPTLVPLKAGVKLGEKEGFSEKDLLKIHKLYDCPMERVSADEPKQNDEKRDGSEEVQALLQKLLKYFEMNFQRLFRTILRTIQKFRPIILTNKSMDDGKR